MNRRAALAAHVAERIHRRFAPRGGPGLAPEGELNAFIAGEVRAAVASLEDPYTTVIRGWGGQAYQLDLTWWEAEETPEEIVAGLAGAILDHEVRKMLDLPV